ncbi:DUF2332 family protein [Streptomyces sp. AM 2-1-1]|uniref:DUF2332 family protein n=1 Tax=Streptomyces sp. AM 2-1-1 TaxID=3028709 RepID=UPI0023B96C3F|nr:DUF2332 family protein [Streptomyces sp. AM 2-1-1]WEH41346.1 DUF2332 family protein [Streptomyces sp. AM 2-1-1]
MFSARKISLLKVLDDMGKHQQGNHGWSLFHESLSRVARHDRSPGLDRVLAAVWSQRPDISDSHAVTLLGIAVRQLAREGGPEDVFRAAVPAGRREAALARVLEENAAEVTRLMESHSNSYTGARRFLLPQLVVGAFAHGRGIERVRLLDLGTSIGMLLRQLNNRVIYERFAGDLHWDPVSPPYREIPLDFLCGVDRPPLPTLDWVRTCHGPSDYYERRFEEVLWSIDQSGTAGEPLIRALDILDLAGLSAFLKAHDINVVTCNFVLYQYSADVRKQIIETVTEALKAPGMLLSMEPSHELTRMGCVVHAYRAGGEGPLHLADVSDAHFMGEVTVHEGLDELTGAGWRGEP